MKKQNTCSVCGAQPVKKNINFTQELDGKVYMVTGVPAEVCSQCGEEYLSPETVEVLQKLIDEGETNVKPPTKTITVPVYHFS